MAAILLSLGALLACASASSNDSVAFRTDMLGTVEFNGEDTSDVAMVMLTQSVGIVCYADWKNPEDGQCNAVSFAQNPPTAGAAIVLTEDRNETDRKTQRFTVTRVSDTMGIVCYTPFGDSANNGRPVCRTLTVNGLVLDAGDELPFRPSAKNVYTMSVAGLTDSRAVLCFQDTSVVTAVNRRDAVCQVLQVSGTDLTTLNKTGNLSYANAEALDNIQSISVTRITDATSMVCYSDTTALQIYCNQLTLNEAGDDVVVGTPFTIGDSKSFGQNLGSSALSVDALSETEGVVCFCNGETGPTCTPVDLSGGSNVSLAGESFVVGTDACDEVSVTAMSDTAAIVCYLDGTGVDRVGKCSGLAYLNREFITGDAVDIPLLNGAQKTFSSPIGSNANNPICETNPCEHWFAVARRDDSNAAVCYSGVGGSPTGRCTAINIPEPTTTATTFTTTETSTTSEHTTTETSTTSATGTTTSATTSTMTSSTTPHTTSGTTTTETTVTLMEDSGAVPKEVAQLMLALLACWALL